MYDTLAEETDIDSGVRISIKHEVPAAMPDEKIVLPESHVGLIELNFTKIKLLVVNFHSNVYNHLSV